MQVLARAGVLTVTRPPGMAVGGGGRGVARAPACGMASWNTDQYSMKFIMCLRPEWCCFRPGTEEWVSEMSQYSQ